MKWKWRRNLKKKKQKTKNQDFNGVWTRDLEITGAMLYQLSYEATDVGSRSKPTVSKLEKANIVRSDIAKVTGHRV